MKEKINVVMRLVLVILVKLDLIIYEPRRYDLWLLINQTRIDVLQKKYSRYLRITGEKIRNKKNSIMYWIYYPIDEMRWNDIRIILCEIENRMAAMLIRQYDEKEDEKKETIGELYTYTLEVYKNYLELFERIGG